YIGILFSIIGTALRVIALAFTIIIIAGICIYVKVLPIFTEVREEVFDKMVNLDEDDFTMKED
ncbi:MAG TPA: hypothetical protein DCZ23_00950, partial [Lachnospiraceae bacterium]|nr:hypothetical protein [Lachnospiraceae bacterium]